jgi:hypothetical protein
MSAEANYSFTVKFNGDLLTIRGDSAAEFGQHLDALLLSDGLIKKASEVQQEVRAWATLNDGAAQLAAAEAALAGTATPVATIPAAAAATPGNVETLPGKFPGQQYTYNLPNAPECLNGDGRMVLKEWTTKAGKRVKAWVDPLDGPKPAKGVGPKADLVWAD